jgi:glycosyltransferase involved in cell wall biosynthesis
VTTETQNVPLVTVLVPCRNEARFIEACLDSIVHNDYPESQLHVLVIDGQSEDGTEVIIERFRAEHRCVTIIENPRRITPTALNLGVKAARGDYIVWMSAHSRYDRGYIRSCVEWALRSGADNVGGIIVAEPRENTVFGRAIVIALAHPFGNGGSKFRMAASEPVWADTVFGGCYRRDVFSRVGAFNENLVRGQDFEFNMRLRRAGLRTLLVPTIRSTYLARSRPADFIRHNWANGVWAILPFRYTNVVPVSFRHLVPMLFVGSVIVSAALGVFFPIFRPVLLLILGSYLVATVWMSASIAIAQRAIGLFFLMPIVFWSLHITYGLGSLWAAIRSASALFRHAVLLGTRKPSARVN